MGCDIHIVIERRASPGARWQLVGKIETTVEDGERYVDAPEPPFLKRRNYVMFAVLAGIRASDSWPPIAPPRGVPADASAAVKRWIRGWHGGHDQHSHSWVTVQELMGYDWARVDADSDSYGNYTITMPVYCATLMDQHGPHLRFVFFFDN